MGERTIELSPEAAAQHPHLLPALVAAGCGSVRIVRVGEVGGEVVVGNGSLSAITTCPARRLCLDFTAADVAFAAALIAAFVGDTLLPAGVHPDTIALGGLATKIAAREVGVLITGPTGTGKEVIARLIHARSPRRDRPFVAVNCAAVPETMFESTLFGYERGAFTGAMGSAPGLFRAAAGGTLLLDEVGELPLALQAKLLRALQEREVLPVGAATSVPIDARIIATANRDLRVDVAAGRFRADLFFRLAVFPMATTPLADRAADVVAIAAALWLRQGIAAWPMPQALARLTAHDWPGNVRELGNVIARAAVLADDGRIDVSDIVFDMLPGANGASRRSLGTSVRDHEQETIRSTLAACSGRRTMTAKKLGISERTLRYKLAAMADGPATPTMQ